MFIKAVVVLFSCCLILVSCAQTPAEVMSIDEAKSARETGDSMAEARNWNARSLSAFARQNNYNTDIKKTKKNEPLSLSKDCCSHDKAWAVVKGFNGHSNYKQVALYCDNCNVQNAPNAHVELCKNEFSSLFKHLLLTELNSEELAWVQILPGGQKRFMTVSEPKTRIRLMSQKVKCDGGPSGQRIRLDFFQK